MKLYAPKYYKDFKCIADQCRHSCCIGWEIDVDENAREKYASLAGEYAEDIRKSIDYADTPHFKLGACEKCVHLDERGLCKIIINCGEDYLCDICREHPRFYNDTAYGKEVGLGMSCEEACRLILSSDNYCEIVCVGEVDEVTEVVEFDTIPLRKKTYSLLSNNALSYTERLEQIHKEFGVSPSMLDNTYWRETIGNLEYLNEEHRELFAAYSSDITPCADMDKQLERALAYFVFRHCTSAQSEAEYRAALGFALFCERLIASVVTAQNEDIFEIARIVSEEIEYSEDNTEAIKFEFSFIC